MKINKVSLFCLSLLLSLCVVTTASAKPLPNPPEYDTPPAEFAYVANLLNQQTAPAQQKFGIATHPWWLNTYLEQFIASFKDLKITTIRLPVEWKTIEPSPDNYDWSLNDHLLNRLNDEGFQIVAEFVTVPPWASLNPEECAKLDLRCAGDKKNDANLTRVAEAAVKRYPFIRNWEFWNEPDQWPYMGMGNISTYSFWLKAFYDGAKKADPTVLVAATSLSGPNYTDWLYEHSEATYGSKPWDAIAYHPYVDGICLVENGKPRSMQKAGIDEVRRIMVAHGDASKPIWITEIGWQDSKNEQSVCMKDAFEFIAKRSYITMLHLHMLHDWDGEKYGLMKVKAGDIFHLRVLRPDDEFVPKQPYYDNFKFYDKRPLPERPASAANVLVFPETLHTVRDAFQRAYARGGLALFGYPKTGQFYELNPTDGKYYLVQYFERVRMEYHPEFKDTPYEVLFGLLGVQLVAERSWYNKDNQPLVPQVQPETKLDSPNTVWFEETQHNLTGAFLTAWQKQGGLAIVGLPLTRVFEEINADDGGIYQVQYFERARMELHKGKAGEADFVLFGLLGNERLRKQGRLLANNQTDTSNYYNPALPEFR